MYLIEAEGKQLLSEVGISTPKGFVVKQGDPLPQSLSYPLMLKAQTVMGGRGKSGLVKEAADKAEAQYALEQIWKQQYTKRPFSQILLEEKLAIAKEYYLSFTFDTKTRGLVLVFSKFGGMDIEVVAKRQPDAILSFSINPLKGLEDFDWSAFFAQVEVKEVLQPSFKDIIEKLYTVFTNNDCDLVEINPLIETKDGQLMATDCKVMIDDTALYRHDFSFPIRTGSRELTEMEQQARAIDARSHRGVVGRTLLEFDGTIGFLSSGGGASITCLDALMSYGGRPANFAEYSGNPEREDVRDLTKLILAKEGLQGFWVVGPTANFTDVYETLAGILDAFIEVKPTFPIVIRRAGPRDDEAKAHVEAMAKEYGLDIQFFGEELSMTESAKVLMDAIETKD